MSRKFNEYKTLDLPFVAEQILHFWEENDIFRKSIETREGKQPFIFFEGPPSANGLPGIHHVMGRTIKDIFCRYKTQKGFLVERKAGWDTHGLPVELGVEKQLGITKEDIGVKISVEQYNKECRQAVMRYTDVWNDLTKKIGHWMDMENPYITYKSKYMESVWWLLKQIYNKNLLYKGYTIQPYSPKAGTGLSSHELNQPGAYRDITDTTIVAQFKAKQETLPDFLQNFGIIHFLAWTTTPWTLPSNTALIVGKSIDYVLIKTFNQYTFEPINVILAKNLVEKQFAGKYFPVENVEDFTNYKPEDKKIPYQILAECKGKDLVEIRYEQLLPFVVPYQNPENAFRVILGDFVTTDDGTGIVHSAPTFGADDAKAVKSAKPEVPPMLVLDENKNAVPLVNFQGKFIDNLGDLSGKYVRNEYYNENETPEKSVDVEIAIRLKEENKAFKVEKYTHSYPHCWRTDKPILYYPLDSWFIKISEVKDRMFELNQTINWKPKATGEGRFGNWLKNANDWNLSRSRYWGIPLPIWRTENKTEEICIGSVEELINEIKKSVEHGFMTKNPFDDFVVGDLSDQNYDLIDLHKNVVDDIILVSEKGQKMFRETDLIDVWFDSGSMPYAQWHYPFSLKLPFKDFGLSDFIAEGVDQTRGWFYTLHAIGTLVFDNIVFKNVVSNGLVLDKNGQKMSKRLGNTVDPFETLKKYGADATRWYMISNANPWDNLKFDVEGIEEVRRKFFGTLYNTYSFFVLYANIDGFKYSENEIPLAQRPEIDRWILSELNSLIKLVDEYYNDYEPTKVARAISDFVQENLSNWYVRLCRRRFWKGDYTQDKISAYQTLYTCLEVVSKLMASVAPFYADRLYCDLNSVTQKDNVQSVHLSDFPKYDKNAIDLSLQRRMQNAQTISSLVLSLRKKERIKVRQPLQKIMIPVLSSEQKQEIQAVSDLIKSEVNVKEIELLDDVSGVLVKQIKPNFKVLGPRFGKNIGMISKEIQNFSQEQIKELEKNGSIFVEINGNNVTLSAQEVEITSQDIPGWLVASVNGITVALDITISEKLKREGMARELINRIQNIRKDSGFEVTDKVNIQIKTENEVANAIKDNLEYIKTETLTENLQIVEKIENAIEIEFDQTKSLLLIYKTH